MTTEQHRELPAHEDWDGRRVWTPDDNPAKQEFDIRSINVSDGNNAEFEISLSRLAYLGDVETEALVLRIEHPEMDVAVKFPRHVLKDLVALVAGYGERFKYDDPDDEEEKNVQS